MTVAKSYSAGVFVWMSHFGKCSTNTSVPRLFIAHSLAPAGLRCATDAEVTEQDAAGGLERGLLGDDGLEAVQDAVDERDLLGLLRHDPADLLDPGHPLTLQQVSERHGLLGRDLDLEVWHLGSFLSCLSCGSAARG